MNRVVFRIVLAGAGLVLASFVVAPLLIAQSPAQAPADLQRFRDPQTLSELIASRTPHRLIDVRTPQEFAAGYIPTAANVEYQNIADYMADVQRDELVVLYCRTGNRSSIAARTLRQMGFTNVVDFGAITRWRGSLSR